MADRTYYSKLEFNQGYLQDVEEAAEDAFGIRSADLTTSESNAISRIQMLITAVVGWGSTKTWHDSWVDETAAVTHTPPVIREMADLIGSSLVWRRLENYNRIMSANDEILMSDRLMRDAMKLWETIQRAGVIVYSDGTDAIDMTEASNNTGVGVSGAAYLFAADYEGESVNGVRPKFSTEGLFKELNGT